jgi:lysozyme
MALEYYEIAKALIKHGEGLWTNIYRCSENKLTIGYGHNLEARGISIKAAEQILDDDMADFTNKAEQYPWFKDLDPARQAVIVDMLFNMGSLDDWKRFQACLTTKDFEGAAKAMEQSLWFKQVGRRAPRNIQVMRSGSTNGVM